MLKNTPTKTSNAFAVAFLAGASLLTFPGAADAARGYSSEHSDTCATLARIAYYAGTAHLSPRDRGMLAQVKERAAQSNAVRLGISPSQIEKAAENGRTSHGNYGAGQKSLDVARDDALVASLFVQEQCLRSDLSSLP